MGLMEGNRARGTLGNGRHRQQCEIWFCDLKMKGASFFVFCFCVHVKFC